MGGICLFQFFLSLFRVNVHWKRQGIMKRACLVGLVGFKDQTFFNSRFWDDYFARKYFFKSSPNSIYPSSFKCQLCWGPRISKHTGVVLGLWGGGVLEHLNIKGFSGGGEGGNSGGGWGCTWRPSFHCVVFLLWLTLKRNILML